MNDVTPPPQREEFTTDAAYGAFVRQWRDKVMGALTAWMRTHFHVEFKAYISTLPQGVWVVVMESKVVQTRRDYDFHKAVYELLTELED